MTEERHRSRHRSHSGTPGAGMDPDRLRYFTQPVDGRPTTRHRRRRGESGAPIPMMTRPTDTATDPTTSDRPGQELAIHPSLRDRTTGQGRDMPPPPTHRAPSHSRPHPTRPVADAPAPVVNGTAPTVNGAPGAGRRARWRSAPSVLDPAGTPLADVPAAPAADEAPTPTAPPTPTVPPAPAPVSPPVAAAPVVPPTPPAEVVPPTPPVPVAPISAESAEAEPTPTEPIEIGPERTTIERTDSGRTRSRRSGPSHAAPSDADPGTGHLVSSERLTDSGRHHLRVGEATTVSSTGIRRGHAGALAALADPTAPSVDEPTTRGPVALGPADVAPDVLGVDTSTVRPRIDEQPGDVDDHEGETAPDAGAMPVRADRSPAARRRRRRRRIGMAIALAVMLVILAGGGGYGAWKAGLFDSRKDYSNTAGVADALVHIPDDSSLKQIGEILADADVVGSIRAFVDAADGAALPGGYYKLRTEIPARTAVEMISDSESTHRVGRVVVPPGGQLATRHDAQGTVTDGIFALIAEQTGVQINGERLGVTVEQLEKAAANDSIADLGVPSWAQNAVTELDGDYRRIEGLIAPGTWESVDPHQSATQILHALITSSARQYEERGLLSRNSSGLSPYETLVASSLVQAEVNQSADYPKVARVILNRLAKNQRLQFDSTANYTAEVVELDVHHDVLNADTPWNTYVHKGLPPTPIGSVAEDALHGMEQPAAGTWLYFVTVDSDGTTLFTADFNQHRRNISRACANRYISCR
ncbi:MAG: endolytic transglycosylase MltG [Gordonia sp. (in: high G+C Gram-positive bacteria)]